MYINGPPVDGMAFGFVVILLLIDSVHLWMIIVCIFNESCSFLTKFYSTYGVQPHAK